MEARIQALRHGALFNSVPEAELAVLAQSMKEERFAPGDVVCEEGEPADRIYVVLGGSLEVHSSGSTHEPIRLGPGQLFGEYGMFDNGLRTATITAREASTLIALDYPRFRNFLIRFPEAMFAILSATVNQLLAARRSQKL